MFVEYSGVDPSLHQASTGDYCGDLVWVPWVVGADTKVTVTVIHELCMARATVTNDDGG
jgi:hypothetical protein